MLNVGFKAAMYFHAPFTTTLLLYVCYCKLYEIIKENKTRRLFGHVGDASKNVLPFWKIGEALQTTEIYFDYESPM